MTQRHGDDGVLKELRARGDAALVPRPVFIWIYGDEFDLRLVEKRLRATWPLLELDDQGDRWALHGEREQVATAEAIYAMSDEIEAALEGTAAKYDGWETSVERAN